MIELLLIILLCVAAAAVVLLKDLLNAVLALAGFSLLVSLLLYILQAPDVALTEAAVGAGISTIIFVLTINKLSRRGQKG